MEDTEMLQSAAGAFDVGGTEVVVVVVEGMVVVVVVVVGAVVVVVVGTVVVVVAGRVVVVVSTASGHIKYSRFGVTRGAWGLVSRSRRKIKVTLTSGISLKFSLL